MSCKVLIIDDEKSIVDVLAYALTKEGFVIDRAYDGQEALDKINSFSPDIIILDLMLPKVSGYDLCNKVQSTQIGIIMISAKSDIVDKLVGLEIGADDYLVKPFDIREVIARVRALSRRFRKLSTQKEEDSPIEFRGITIHPKQRVVSIEGIEIELTAKEFELLYLLLSKPNAVFSRDELLNIVWDMDYLGGTRTVDTHIQRLRKKLGANYEDIIATVHGVGYKGVRS